MLVNPSDHTLWRPSQCVAKMLSKQLAGQCRLQRKSWRYVWVTDTQGAILVAIPMYECVTHKSSPRHHISQLNPLCQVGLA